MITGTDIFIFSYIDKCKKGLCDDMEKYIADSPLYLQSSGELVSDDHYRNYNVFY